MKVIRNAYLTLKMGVLVPLALLCLSVTSHAHADTVLLADTTMVTGSESAVFSFNAPTTGMVTAQLLNLPWPERLSALDFTATTANSVVSSWSAPTSASESFLVTPGTYFAHIMATTAGGALDAGLYSLTLTFSPSTVPLPATDWMLVIGVLVLFGLTRVLSAFGSFTGMKGSSALHG